MTIDLDDIESRIKEGIYGDSLIDDDSYAALAVLLAEVERLREMLLNAGWPRRVSRSTAEALRYERAAVVSFLRAEADFRVEADFRMVPGNVLLDYYAEAIERGEHRNKS
jgi:hypothetical protein